MAQAGALVLASASPRRKELLSKMGVVFTCISADIDETPHRREPAGQYVERMAQEKAHAVLERSVSDAALVLAADTSVILDGVILGKPESPEDAHDMLRRLSGRSHLVMTAIALGGSGEAMLSAVITTEVFFVELGDPTIAAYLETDEPWDKAGAYGIQGIAGAFVKRINGSYSNVVGLPLAETRDMLTARGVPTLFDRAAITQPAR